MQKSSLFLLQYAGYLLIIGLASAFYNAANVPSERLGWNSHGASGLYACGGAAVVVAILGAIAGRGQRWAAWAGLVLAFLFMAYGAKTCFGLLRDMTGHAEKIAAERSIHFDSAHRAVFYKVCIFGALTIVSLSTFLRVGLNLRRDPAA